MLVSNVIVYFLFISLSVRKVVSFSFISKRLNVFPLRAHTDPSTPFSYVANIFNHSISVVDITNDRKQYGSRCYDLSSPREWMEYLEAVHSSAGAYTVLRCDFSQSENITKAHLWGLEFHLERLCSSFESFKTNEFTDTSSSSCYEKEVEATREIISALIDETKQTQASSDSVTDETNKTITSMITILWSKRGHEMHVQGHLFSNNKRSDPLNYECPPITAVLAGVDPELPSRYDYIPSAKLSSWCRIRRPLEDQFKTNGVGEILLSRNISSSTVQNLELLEGLTSNLFMVYRDGTIRSPTKGVLHGFAQSLVIKAAENLGLKIVDEPITLQDARDGLWVESFVTSSVRLIIPVNRIIYENSVAPLEWTESKLDDLEWNRRRWRLLYDSIMNSCYFKNIC